MAMTGVKSRGILFSAPMVRAILAGKKTQTRRVVKPQPRQDEDGDWYLPPVRAGQPARRSLVYVSVVQREHMRAVPPKPGAPETINAIIRCPYGAPGDELWVRETWCQAVDPSTSRPIAGKAHYRADGVETILDDGDGSPVENKDGTFASPWKPSIHMPRWASRITLRVTDVRVERLQDISEGDARAEGIDYFQPGYAYSDERKRFRVGWDDINGERGFTWESNPFVWAITFERTKP